MSVFKVKEPISHFLPLLTFIFSFCIFHPLWVTQGTFERDMLNLGTMLTLSLEDGAAGVLRKTPSCGCLRAPQRPLSDGIVICLLICMGTCTLPHGGWSFLLSCGFWRRTPVIIPTEPSSLLSQNVSKVSFHKASEHLVALCFSRHVPVAEEVKIPEMRFLLRKCSQPCTEEKTWLNDCRGYGEIRFCFTGRP